MENVFHKMLSNPSYEYKHLVNYPLQYYLRESNILEVADFYYIYLYYTSGN